jgi:hypothetical protein
MMQILQPFRLIGRLLPAFLSLRRRNPEKRREHWHGLVHEDGARHLRKQSTSVLGRPERNSGRRGIANRLRSQHRFDGPEVDLSSRSRTSGPFVAALRPFPELFFSHEFAQDSGHTSRVDGVASGEQSVHDVGGGRIAIFCPDKVDHGIGQSLVFGSGLSQKRLKNSDDLPELCPLALQGVNLFIKRFEFFSSALKRPLIFGFHIGPTNSRQYRRTQ